MENTNQDRFEANNQVNLYESTPVTEQVTEKPTQTTETSTTEPVIETPVVETPTQETPAVETPAPVVTEKIVEKVIEKGPEFKDDYSKTIYQAILEGKEDVVKDYLDRKFKNYDTMADIDVVRENLKLQNPKWNENDVDLEIRSIYGKIPQKKDLFQIDRELSPDEYEAAERFNEAIEEKENLLSRNARDARISLESSKQTLELPKISVQEPQKEAELTPEQLSAQQKEWEDAVDSAIPNLPDLKFSIKNGEENEEVVYVASAEEKQQMSGLMKGFDDLAYLTKRGWYGEDGSINILKIAEDVRKLENFDKIVASAATTMRTEAKKDVFAEIKNINLNHASTSPELGMSVGEKIWG